MVARVMVMVLVMVIVMVFMVIIRAGFGATPRQLGRCNDAAKPMQNLLAFQSPHLP